MLSTSKAGHKRNVWWSVLCSTANSPGAKGSNPGLRVNFFFFAGLCRLGIGLTFSGGWPKIWVWENKKHATVLDLEDNGSYDHWNSWNLEILFLAPCQGHGEPLMMQFTLQFIKIVFYTTHVQICWKLIKL